MDQAGGKRRVGAAAALNNDFRLRRQANTELLRMVDLARNDVGRVSEYASVEVDDLMIIERYIAKSKEKLAPGKHTIVVDTTMAKPGAPAEIVLSVDGKEVARTITKRTVPLAFTASETLDVGIDLGSPVSHDYHKRRPFKFEGKIRRVDVKLK